MWIVEGAVLERGEILLECQELTLVAAIAREGATDLPDLVGSSGLHLLGTACNWRIGGACHYLVRSPCRCREQQVRKYLPLPGLEHLRLPETARKPLPTAWKLDPGVPATG